MLRFGETKVAKEKFYGAKKQLLFAMLMLIIDVDRCRSWEAIKKYKTIWTKLEGLKNIDLNALPVYDDR